MIFAKKVAKLFYIYKLEVKSLVAAAVLRLPPRRERAQKQHGKQEDRRPSAGREKQPKAKEQKEKKGEKANAPSHPFSSAEREGERQKVKKGAVAVGARQGQKVRECCKKMHRAQHRDRGEGARSKKQGKGKRQVKKRPRQRDNKLVAVG